MKFLEKTGKICFLLLILCGIFSSISCSADVNVELKKDGSVSVAFDGLFGEGLVAIINSMADEEGVFDTKQITYELTKSGFDDVKAVARGNREINLSMSEKTQKSYLYTSGMFSVKNQKISICFKPETLKNFYSMCDEQIVLYLDLLLAPVFNDEKMSSEEYIETLAAFYGNECAEELKSSDIKVTIKNPDGYTKTSVISVADLLTLQTEIDIN